jgi:hypothetical protein
MLRMAENVEAVGSAESEGAEASPEKVGFSPVAGRSGANIGARIGDTEGAPLKCRLRLDRQRGVGRVVGKGSGVAGMEESAEIPGVVPGLGFCGYGN